MPEILVAFIIEQQLSWYIYFILLNQTVDNMASYGLRAISYHDTQKVEAPACRRGSTGRGYKPSHTPETLTGYIVCYSQA
jgi:hypothetical protein